MAAQEGFAKIRNGIRAHIKQGKLCPFDLGVYVYLHMECDWSTGVFHGTASGIAHGFDDEGLKNSVQKSLARLRREKFINYRDGDGRRRGYDILIHKYEPQFGARSGQRLNAWKNEDKVEAFYESGAKEAVEEALRRRGASYGEGAEERPTPYIPNDPNRPDEPLQGTGREETTGREKQDASLRPGDPGPQGVQGLRPLKPAQGSAQTLQDLVNESNIDARPSWFDELMSTSVEVRRKVIAVAHWVEAKSDFWKGKPCFGLKGYRAMEKSYDNFYARLPEGKKPHQLHVKNEEGDATAPMSCVDCRGPANTNVDDNSDWFDDQNRYHCGCKRVEGLSAFLEGVEAEDEGKCSCVDPMPDANGDCPEMYGISCRRCGKFLKYPEDSTPSKAFEIED